MTGLNLHSDTLPRVDGQKPEDARRIKPSRTYEAPGIFSTDRLGKTAPGRRGGRVLPHKNAD